MDQKERGYSKSKVGMRPILFLLYAYLPEHYKNRTGTMRKVLGKIWGKEKTNTIFPLIFCYNHLIFHLVRTSNIFE